MAALTPTLVQKSTEGVVSVLSGTGAGLETFLIKVTKAAQNDTIVTTTHIGSAYTTDKIVALSGITIPAGGDSVQEAPTVDDSDDEIVLPSATTGTTCVIVSFQL